LSQLLDAGFHGGLARQLLGVGSQVLGFIFEQSRVCR
jgi:hypothetical protein